MLSKSFHEKSLSKGGIATNYNVRLESQLFRVYKYLRCGHTSSRKYFVYQF